MKTADQDHHQNDAEGMERAPAGITREILWVTLGSLLLFAALFWPWLRDAASSIPDPLAEGNHAGGADTRLIIWILAWNAHAVLHQPLRLFDANIFHPQPGMLAGSETLFSSSLLAAPIFWLTDNAVLAANVVAMASYPFALVAMYALMRRLHYGRFASLFAAVVFALGPFRVPLDLRVLQYPNYLLPAVLLAAQRARHGPRGWLALTVAFALSSSLYMAAMTMLVLGIEVLLVAWSAGFRRAIRVASATIPGLLLFALAAVPFVAHARWIQRPELMDALTPMLQRLLIDPDHPIFGTGWAVAVLALLGFITPLLARARARQKPDLRWWRWVAIAFAGLLLAAGPHLELGSRRIPLPYELFRGTPLAALRAYPRFLIPAHLGLAGLAATAVETMLRLLSRQRALAGLAAAGTLAWAFLPRAAALYDRPLRPLEVGKRLPPVYAALQALPPGPLLEIPGPWLGPNLGRKLIQSEFMVASTHHWRPLVNGHTGYPPWWFRFLLYDIEALPDPAAARAVINATGVRAIIVHREHVSAAAWARWQSALLVPPDSWRGSEIDGHLLIEVLQRPDRPWLAALGSGSPDPDHTILGTPRKAIPADRASASLAFAFPYESIEAAAGARLAVQVVVTNQGDADWPALAPPVHGFSQLVVVEATFRGIDGAPAGEPQIVPLWRDMLPFDHDEIRVDVVAPTAPGTYDLALRVRQIDGASFASSEPLEVRVEVGAPISER